MSQFNVRFDNENDLALLERAAQRVGMKRTEFARVAMVAAARALLSPDLLLNGSPAEIRCQP